MLLGKQSDGLFEGLFDMDEDDGAGDAFEDDDDV